MICLTLLTKEESLELAKNSSFYISEVGAKKHVLRNLVVSHFKDYCEELSSITRVINELDDNSVNKLFDLIKDGAHL